MTTGLVDSYNELYDANGWKRRPFEAVEARTGIDICAPAGQLAETLAHDFRAVGLRILPVPLALAESEFATIRRGVTQRAAAMRHLFHDLFAGPARITSAAQSPLSTALVDDILAAEGWDRKQLQALWDGKEIDDVCFIYGPDLVRNPQGNWVVLEDNVGCIGGVADAEATLQAFCEMSGVSPHPALPMGNDIRAAGGRFVELAGLHPQSDEVVAIASHSSGTDPLAEDHETGRKRLALQELGIRVVDPSVLTSAALTGDSPRAVVNIGSPAGPDIGDAFRTLFTSGTVKVLNGPGLGVLSHKAWLTVFDEIVRFYLDEAPILATTTTRFASAEAFHADDLVLKRSNGCGGSEVFFLSEYVPERRAAIAASSALWGAGSAVLQSLVEHSHIPVGGGPQWCRFRVELRPVTYVLPGSEIMVSSAPAGRAALSLGDRRGNVSQGALNLAVMREPVPSARS